MDIILDYKGERLKIKDARECKGLEKLKGLIFSSGKTEARLFGFNKPVKKAIHSFFCPEFLAVWLCNGKIQELKVVKSNKFSIKPWKKFDTLIEIPINKRYEKVLKSFKIPLEN